MPARPRHRHAVIDGSNLATEGRKEPSLAQLREAVAAIEKDYDFTNITVIVDATFEHRVASSETKAARAAVDNGELITPPAGVIGRGDAFILEVADRAAAVVFSNDSFQEFHGTYDWLFDEGRLIGGKPVPGVGWVYVTRSPVRGPVSRRATATKSTTKKRARTTSAAGGTSRPRKTTKATVADEPATPTEPTRSKPSRRTRGSGGGAGTADGSNDASAWARFRDDYPVGSTIAATVERFSSHGAYASVDGISVYLPNRLLGDPPPSKARDVVDAGATMEFLVHRYDEARHGIDAGLVAVPESELAAARGATTGKTTAKRSATKATAKKTATKKTATKAATKKATKKTVTTATTKRAATRKAATKKTATKAAAKKATKKAATKKAATKAGAKKATTARKTASTAAKKTTGRR